MLGPLLFLVYINDLHSRVLKFADDTKLFNTVLDHEDIDGLQIDTEKVCKWSEKWLVRHALT